MTLIIAEAGVNHNGDEKKAIQLVQAAHSAGADIVKFQTFKASSIATKLAKKAKYQQNNSSVVESQLDMLKKLELNQDSFLKIYEYCNSLGIEFMSTAFDSESLNFLVDELKLTKLKIPSGELTNAPFILEMAKTNSELILSTGMANTEEIEDALGVIAYGLTNSIEHPSKEAFTKAYHSLRGQELLSKKVSLLHCTSEYPAQLNSLNLNAIPLLKRIFKLPVGYSDHSTGILVPIAATVSGATIIEKHFTLNKQMKGPDHKASLEPEELKSMVLSIRNVEKIMGKSIKIPQQGELINRNAARKSIVANGEIKLNQIFTESNIAIKRPGSGMSPYSFWELIGEKASQSYKDGDLIDE